MDASVIIIGAGIAGLSAGCYGQMNGYRTRILEMHDKPGGLCTSWQRREYTFDGGIRCLVGSGPGASAYYQMWRELGAARDWMIVDHEEFAHVEGARGKEFILYTDLDRLERHMKALAPQDTPAIEEYARAARLLCRFDPPMATPPALMGPVDRLRLQTQRLPFAETLRKYSQMSLGRFVARFSDPFLREALLAVWGTPDYPMAAVLGMAAFMHTHSAGYPLGGSLAFTRSIVRRYSELGGEVHYGARVVRILVEDGRAVGVRLADGTEQRASVVISAAGGYSTLFELLAGQDLGAEARERYERRPRARPVVRVSLGVARDFALEPHAVSYPLDQPLVIAGEVRRRMDYQHYCYDPTMAPAGKSVLISSFRSSYDYWQRLAGDQRRRRAEKRRIATAVIAQLERRFPGLAGQVEEVDVATPLGCEHRTGSWQGAMEGWLLATQTLGKIFVKTLPGLDRFYLAGQWVGPGGGVPAAAMSGRHVIQILCHHGRRRFVAHTG